MDVANQWAIGSDIVSGGHKVVGVQGALFENKMITVIIRRHNFRCQEVVSFNMIR